ncbi:MAG: 2,3-bisphosphoglycerate-independent phosphoglycerate mutase [Saprospiraceae bacterium]|nr:2,3-bisphosphoglycerate-independent phosphoglycerate mutase [Saprospiraceae bacterium]
MLEKKVMLIILDGWGLGKIPEVSAINGADTPIMDQLYKDYPNAELATSGEAVGLPEGQMGNSEVGHLNIGAGRIVYQELARIHKAIKDGSLKENEVLQSTFNRVKAKGNALHLIGLVSDGGVHSHIDHLLSLVDYAREAGLEKIFVHAFTDGRDVAPDSGIEFLRTLKEKMDAGPGELVSVTGRYYAMDRDQRWERTRLAYDCLVHGKGDETLDVLTTVKERYDRNETDEFIKPMHLVRPDGTKPGLIEEGDTVLCFNFRTDRPRQITRALSQEDFPDHGMNKIPLDFVTMTSYDATFEGIDVLFKKSNLENTLGDILSNSEKTQVRIAETEKYRHVTFFFNGGREEPFSGEKRIMIPSPKVATYDLQPEMSADEVTNAIIEEIKDQHPDFICLNFANPDMVGHTGIMEAAIKAVSTVDGCLGSILEVGKPAGYEFIIIADHGNADIMINPDGSPHTAHTTNPVPIIYVGDRYSKIKSGKLADIAPTILHLLGVEIPSEMDGEILVA